MFAADPVAPVGACRHGDTFVNLQLSSDGQKYTSGLLRGDVCGLRFQTAFLPAQVEAHVCAIPRSADSKSSVLSVII